MSLRKYITELDFAQYLPTEIFNQNLLDQAEQDIDNIICIFTDGSFRKSFANYEIQANVAITATTATLSNNTGTNGYYAYTVLEILSGANAGARIFVNSNVANVLSFDNQTITGTFDCKIYQYGKAPFVCDTVGVNNAYYKSISSDIKQAVIYQYMFRKNNANLFNTNFTTKSYEVDKDRYQEDFDTQRPNSIEQRISAQALDIISYLNTHI